MIGKDGSTDTIIRYRAFAAAMSHLAAARSRVRRRRDKRAKRRSLLRLLMPGQEAADTSPDPVKLAVLALDALAGASMRASCTGTEVEVAAPDEATASVLRAALAETARNRATDRLIRITVG